MNGYANIDPGGDTGQMQALAQGQPPPAPIYDLVYVPSTGDYWVFLGPQFMGEIRIMGGPAGEPPKYNVHYWDALGNPVGPGTWTR